MYSIVPFIIKVITISSYNTCIFYINTAAIAVAINLNILYGYKIRSHKFFAVNRLRKITWASQVGSRAKIRTTYTSHPRSARQEVDGERTHARRRTHVDGKATGEATDQTQPPTHYNRHSARWPGESREVAAFSRPMGRKAYRYLCIYHIKVIDCQIIVQSNLSFQSKM